MATNLAIKDPPTTKEDILIKVKVKHGDMVARLANFVFPKANYWKNFVTLASAYLDPAECKGSLHDIVANLLKKGHIDYGQYDILYDIVNKIDKPASHIIEEAESEIKTIRKGEIHADLVPMIETTKAMITEELKETFINTKAFRAAKTKLKKNRVVVIKGNTGDGKTCTAIQLLHWLIEEQHDRQPVQIHNIKDFKLLAPKSKMITFVDDIFGEKSLRKKEVQEWNKRIRSVIPSLCGDLQTEANFLVITVRNEVFSSLKKNSLETIFTDLNITDLSTNSYKVAEEKKPLLDLYEPKNSTFSSWTKKEKEEIVKCTPNVGFPQCCRLFRDISLLQKERVKFFEKPFYFLNGALSKFGECPGLLFLFLSNGMIKVKDLDPNSETVNKSLLEEAFEIDLIDGDDDRTSLKYKKKVEFVKKSLDKLLGFLVVKEKHFWFGDVYSFCHDSIYVAVALLYGEKTPIGYIRNCPRKSLNYITTSKTSQNMIVISSDHYTHMCERLLREFVSEENDYGTSIASLDVWKDRVFVESFLRLLNDRKVDKCAVLNKACLYGAEECALYLLSEGVKPDKDTPFCVVERRCVNVLQKVVTHLNDKIKRAMLNKACESGAEECALYLLSEGVKPDRDTPLCMVRGGCVNVFKTIVNDLNDEIKLAVLNKACSYVAEECALYLLSEGVKPDKYTPWWSLINGDVDVLRKVIIYLNNKMKLAVLKKACVSGSEECALYLLSEGVKPDKYTPWWSLINGDVDVLRKVIIYLNNKMKLAVLNKACESGSEECALCLLSEGVKPDKYTPWWSFITGGIYGHDKGDVDVLRKVVIYLNDEMKLAVLNGACTSGSKECALYLLSEGVKPDEDTPFLVLYGGCVDLLSEILQYDVTPTARYYNNNNVLHMACECKREEMVTVLCDAYPHLVHDTDDGGRTPLHVAAQSGNCSVFDTVRERYVNPCVELRTSSTSVIQ